MICPLPISTRTWDVVAPFLTSRTVPFIWLRALRRMMVSTYIEPRSIRRGHGGLLIEEDGSVVPVKSLCLRHRRPGTYQSIPAAGDRFATQMLLLGVGGGQHLAAFGR